ncbi:MAG: hypothetical protein ABDI20_01625 [Candidatus Bipolaricaulaceae bacterium]
MLGYLLRRASAGGEVRERWPRVAAELEVSLATVKRARTELVAAGELVLREKGGGRGRASRYRLTRLASDLERAGPSGGGGRALSPGTPEEHPQGKPAQAEPVHKLVQAVEKSMAACWSAGSVGQAFPPWFWEAFRLVCVAGLAGLTGGLIVHKATGDRERAIQVGLIAALGAGLWWVWREQRREASATSSPAALPGRREADSLSFGEAMRVVLLG